MKLISVVTPCFNEEKNIHNCYLRVKEVFNELKTQYNYEHIFCDNCSDDSTINILREISKKDKNIKVIINSRNYGILKNNYNGILSAAGDAIVLFMPADLQDPPELIPKFIQHWEKGNEIVYGLRKKREESLLLVIMRKIYYRILSKISNINYPPDAGDYQLIDRVVLNAIKKTYIADPFIRMSTFDAGYKAIGIPYTWTKREHGKSKNSFLNMLIQGLDGITSFSNLPIRFTIIFGILISFLSFAFTISNWILVLLNIIPKGGQGTITLISGIFILGGVQIFSIGVVGEYVVRVLNQVRKKPHVIERERINF